MESAQREARAPLPLPRILFAIPPTGAYCREDRCQSYFKFDLIPSMRAPLEECEAAGAIRRVGGIARVIDAPAARLSEADFGSAVSAFEPSVVLLVVTFGTLDDDLAWASRLKERLPGVPIGVRGAPCYVMDHEILERYPAVDFCVRGEYEIIFDELARLGIDGARGVTIRRDGLPVRSPEAPREENLDLLPFPDRSAIDPSLYTVRGFGKKQATVRVQRGCPYPCTYCLVHTVSGNRARHRSPGNIAEEVRGVMDSGVRCFYLRADTFSLDRSWTLELCEALRRSCPGMSWVTTTRVERVDDEVLRAMRGAGCYGVSFGLDVASKAIGKRVKKLADPEIAERAMRLCDRHGILSLAYIMIGFLWETEETLEESRRFIHRIRPDLLTVHFAHPYPGTEYYDDFVRSGRPLVSPRAQSYPAAESDGVSTARLREVARAMLLRHYLRPSVIASLARKGAARALGRSSS